MAGADFPPNGGELAKVVTLFRWRGLVIRASFKNSTSKKLINYLLLFLVSR
jgi:hypothetical protein